MPEKPLEWFIVYSNFHKHLKFRELRRLMKLSKKDAAGLLTLFWACVANLAADGNLAKIDSEEFAHEMEWKKRWGSVENFFNVLREVGFIDGEQVHDWQDTQYLIKDRVRKRDIPIPGNSRKFQEIPGNSRIDFDPGLCSFINISNSLLETFSSKYPALGIDGVKREIGKMEGWLMANPKNRKSNYMRFITNWLSKTQDRAARVETKTQEEKPYEYVMVNGQYVKKVKE